MAPRLPRRWILPLLFSCLVVLMVISRTVPNPANSILRGNPHAQSARRIMAKELLARPLARNSTTIPKLIHQSWKDDILPEKFETWSRSCRTHNPDWEWVLWTDQDNDALVGLHYSWFADTYKALPSPVNRADVARYMYMDMFGGVYIDLDTECLRPYQELFEMYDTSTTRYPASWMSRVEERDFAGRRAFFGRMGMELDYHDSIPNAWMASTPAHPFFLLPIERIQGRFTQAGKWIPGSLRKQPTPEQLTGPGNLFKALKEYSETYYGKNVHEIRLYKKLSASPGQLQREMPHSVTILPWWYVFPYSWARDGEQFRDVCWVTRATFDAERCKNVVAVDAWPSYSITYWSHSWSDKGHDAENMNRLEAESDVF